ncbi:MAG TPA: hypothetical protein ENJ31_08245, partial [Anaerolineae bacterium]|nr:hypothetical protein [Anaerolineae bacterium]
TFSGLKPEREGELARVQVQFNLDVNGILHVKAYDRGSGQEAGITVAASKKRLTQEQISQAQARLAETVTAIVLDEGSQALVDRAQKLLQSGDLSPEDAQDLAEALDMVDQARRQGNEADLDAWLEELTDILYDLE